MTPYADVIEYEGKFRVRITDHDGKRHLAKQSFDTANEAQEAIYVWLKAIGATLEH